jgi:FAD/FMN-containing dehydrogenase
MAGTSGLQNDDRLTRLLALVPADIICTDETTRILMAQDVLTKSHAAIAVVAPRSTDELATSVKAIIDCGFDAIPRGGGMSYTSGYVPASGNAVMVDMSTMNRILDINETDMTVTVEAGCTWSALHEALKPRGLRTPFWGSLSGKYATIGGGASQNAVFWGCGTHGSAAESILAMDVVLADGSILTTAPGHFRPYGPDLTGLFSADTGALGFKATITLKLMREAKAFAFASFSFASPDRLIPAMSEIARSGLASECFGFDPFLQAQRMKRESLTKDAKALMNMMKAQGSFLGALKEGAKVALAGRNFLDNVPFSLHVIVEGRQQISVDADMAEVKRIAAKFQAAEVENSIPKILRANPFGPVNSMVGPQGERWAPVHGILPHSKALACIEKIEELYEQSCRLIDQYRIGTGYLFATVGVSGFVVEPVFFWPDALTEIHHEYVEAEHLAKIDGFAADPEARAVVMRLRKQLVDLFHDMGAAHLQIGKTYRHNESIGPAGRRILDAVKSAVDPDRRINPGSLGLH